MAHPCVGVVGRASSIEDEEGCEAVVREEPLGEVVRLEVEVVSRAIEDAAARRFGEAGEIGRE